jgi:2-amino-4-hydroxy-6-hydroxymethyldihydropteridine diphosphokinase
VAAHRYLIALGSNQRHRVLGRPAAVLHAALAQLPGRVEIAAPVQHSAPLGPSRRRYANGAAVIATDLRPEALLAALKAIERHFGRRRGGQPWRARVLDLDIVLWSGGCWASHGLIIPHPLFRDRTFVLGPASVIAPRWRDPLSGLTVRQLKARLTRPHPLPR